MGEPQRVDQKDQLVKSEWLERKEQKIPPFALLRRVQQRWGVKEDEGDEGISHLGSFVTVDWACQVGVGEMNVVHCV